MNKFLIAAALSANLAVAAPLTASAVTASADEYICPPVIEECVAADEEITPYATAKIVVGTTSDSEYVYAHAKNSFVLFGSAVAIQIYLYSSATLESSIENMTLEATNSNTSLGMNNEITCSAKHTEQRYWCAYAVFNANGNTNTAMSTPVLYDTDGTKLS